MNNAYIHPAPTYQITLDGEDITPAFKPYLVQLSLTEKRSDEADQLDLTFTDAKGTLNIPRKGVTLSLALGYKHEQLVSKGTFIVDEVEYSGPPDQLTMRARSAKFTGALRRSREQSWHNMTIRQIVETIASRNALQNSIDAGLANKLVDHIDQTGESDIAFLARLGRMYDAVATVKNETLLFLSTSNTKTSKGASLPQISLARRDTQSFTYTAADRDSYTGVRAFYSDKNAADKKSVLIGTDENVKELPDLHESQKAAKEAAESEYKNIERSTATMSITLSTGRPELMPQTPISVSGFKQQINETKWLTVSVSHTFSNSSGLITSLELEKAN